MEIHYVISWYDKDTDILLGEIEADSIPFADLQQLFTLKAGDVFLYDSHLIDQQQALAIRTWIPIDFDFDQHIYQLDCFQKVKIPAAFTN